MWWGSPGVALAAERPEQTGLDPVHSRGWVAVVFANAPQVTVLRESGSFYRAVLKRM